MMQTNEVTASDVHACLFLVMKNSSFDIALPDCFAFAWLSNGILIKAPRNMASSSPYSLI
jgi:hypothetical protein